MQPDILIAILIFVCVGFIVSMDVAGLTLSKTEEFCAGVGSPVGWSISNACWHAGLLAVYVLVISGVLTISPDIFACIGNLLRSLWEFFPALPDSLLAAYLATASAIEEHLNLLLGIVALAIVWRTYSAKIISRPENANINDMPILARSVFNAVDLVARLFRKRVEATRIVQFVNDQAQAALVAVDMLALAILLKSIRYIEQPLHAFLAVVIVWVVVFLATFATTHFGMSHFRKLQSDSARCALKDDGKGQDDSQDNARTLSKVEVEYGVKKASIVSSMEWARISFRLAEPFLIFYFVLQLVSMLLTGRHVHGVSLYFGAALLLWALVDRWKLPVIVDACLAPAQSGRPGDDSLRPVWDIVRDAGELLLVLAKYVGLVLLIVGVFSAFLWFRIRSGLAYVSFDAEISYLLSMLGLLASLVFFPLFTKFDWVQRQKKRIQSAAVALLKAISRNRRTYVYMAGALLIATLTPVYGDFVDNATKAAASGVEVNLEFSGTHLHALQVGVWLAYLFVVATLVLFLTKESTPDSTDGPALSNEELRTMLRESELRERYAWILPLASILLIGVGWLQSLITS